MFRKSTKQRTMFNRKVVQNALYKTWALECSAGNRSEKNADCLSSATSKLIYDVFGGEIRKYRRKNGWHFYNRINGERIDFTLSEMVKTDRNNRIEDLPATPDETDKYITQEDYSTFFLRFIRAFEETVGLKKYRINMTA